MNKYIYYPLIFFLYLNINLYSQSASYKGIFYFDAFINNYNNNNLYSTYIPEISLSNDIDKNSFIDFNWSYLIRKNFTNSNDNARYRYRLWARYANTDFDFRVGLQKISFGPAYILRPLSWFDTIDFTDLIEQTRGVKSMRLIYTPSNNLSVWTWLIDSDSKIPSYGTRIELSNNVGDWGITYHKSEGFENMHKLGFDYRYDGIFGFWTENSFQYNIDDSSKISATTIGFDYTIPILNGIYIMTETMHSNFHITDFHDSNTHLTVTAFNVDLPIDLLNKFSIISGFEWNGDGLSKGVNYHVLRWIITYDDFNIDINTTFLKGEWSENFRIRFVYNH